MNKFLYYLLLLLLILISIITVFVISLTNGLVFFSYPLILLIIGILIAHVIYKVKLKSRHLIKIIMSYWGLYFILIGIYSASPRLQIFEFTQYHPSWEKVEAKIVGYHTHTILRSDFSQPSLRLRDYYASFTTIMYFYPFQNGANSIPAYYSYSVKTAHYRNWIENPKKEAIASNNLVKKAIQNNSYSLYINPDNPRENKFFISHQWFSIHESALIEFIPFVCLLFIFMGLINFHSILIFFRNRR